MGDNQQFDGIAIIGMAGRFPGAENIAEFWSNVLAGVESVSFFTDAEIRESGLDPQLLRSRGNYVPARGVLRDADCFDPEFFGIHPKEAEVMDPQQRLFLETCWSALENSGYAPNQVDAVVGVFGGVSFNTFFMHALHPRPDLIELIGSELVMFGNEKDYVTTRVAYKLGMKGPALNVSTACSTSLVAVAQACQSLLTYQCDFALAGGASVTVPQKRGYFHDEGNIGSADGHTRTFDSRATGTAFGNGVAIVVLKRMEDAVKDGDQIYAVIKGAALNNDGSQRVSFGAPGVVGQSKVIAMAHALAGVSPDSISYVEAHGTATPLGDPIEVAALTKAFREQTNRRQFCALGSVKSNVGHLDVAAGVTGLIKTALSLRHRTLPATLHFVSANPKLDLENSPFFVNAKLRPWETSPGSPRRAGVSSFGSGGTNAHVVVEEAPELPPSGPSRPWQVLPLSAKTPEALDRATTQLSDFLRSQANSTAGGAAATALADAVFTLQTGRTAFPYRRIAVCQDSLEGAEALQAKDPKRVFSHHQPSTERPIIFMFPGQGAQYPGMAASLYQTEPVFRREVDRCVAVLQPILKSDLRVVLFPPEGSEKQAEETLLQTSFTQPALFVIEYALAKLWISWGIKPSAMIGHSVGEYVAGCLAEVFKLEDALSLVARRGALVQAQPAGAMLVVRQSEKEIQPLLGSELSIAAINSPNLCVVAGPFAAIESLEKTLQSLSIVTKRLHTSHAFHSSMMDPVLPPFTELLRKVSLGAPTLPYVSNVTARWVTPAEAIDPNYWAGHVRRTVRFADGISELLKDPNNVLLEVGPGQTLSTLARQHPSKPADQIVLSSLPLAGAHELRGFFETFGRLWMSGAIIDWHSFYANERRHRVALPSYPFERKRCWPQPPAAKLAAPLPEVNQLRVPAGPPSIGESATTAPQQTEQQPTGPRIDRLVVAVRTLLTELSGYNLAEADLAADLMELGFDSLLLTQASQVIQRKFNVPISFRQLMEELGSVQSISSYLDSKLPPSAFAPSSPVSVAVPSAIATPAGSVAQAPALEQLLQQQQLLTSHILQLLGRQNPSASVAPAAPPFAPTTKSEGKSHGPFKPFDPAATAAMSPGQRDALASIIARYTARTPQSKKLAAENRPILADPRSASGFNRLWKEMVYPILTTRSDGSRVWDVDGNEYVDFVMGFGASLFGHRPPFVVRAVQEQLALGFEIGPIQPIVGEVAALIREFVGMDRVAFTNTGSEAVLAATRIARTVTGRNKIAVFAGAYHGIFDEVLFRPLTVNGEMRTATIAPGVPQSAVSEVIVLDYGNPQSLEIISTRGSEIAAVLVEPVQSRRLDLQPKEFLHELRRVSQEIGAALIFDEVVTGFRVEPGGAQSYFGVSADIATYGKVIGGGLPIGAVAGSPKYMDALDGGQWQYGDNSFPEVGVTFFAGTFVRHPLALAAAKAVLTHLKNSGPSLQASLTARTVRLADELRSATMQAGAPYLLTQFSSIIQLNYPSDQKFAGLLFYLLRLRGIHIWDNRAFILTTAHTESDLQMLVRVFRESLAELKAAGFFSAPPATHASKEREHNAPVPSVVQFRSKISPSGISSSSVGTFPLTEAQKEIWLAAQMGGDAALAYNESLKFDFRGEFHLEHFRAAARQVVDRHPMLLATINPDGSSQTIHPGGPFDLPLVDLQTQPETDREDQLAILINDEISSEFDLTTGPLLRAKIVRLSADHHVVLWTAHHIICDGWSGGLIVSELAKIYSALQRGTQPELESPVSFEDYVRCIESDPAAQNLALSYWAEQFKTIPTPLDLPTDRPRSAVRTARASTVKRDLGAPLQQSLKRFAGQQRSTLVVLLMSGLQVLLHRLTGQTDLVVGLGVAGQAMTGSTCLVGHCVNLLPIRTQLEADASFQTNLTVFKKRMLDAYDHSQTTIGTILQHINVPRSADRPPLVEVIFNVDRDPGEVEFKGAKFSCERNAKRALHYDLFFNVVEGVQGLYVECDFNSDLFDSETIERWLSHYQTLLDSIQTHPTDPLATQPILSPSEITELLETFNDTKTVFPSNAVLHELIEAQVRKSPDAPAVTFDGRSLTYAALNRRANQLAHHLRKLNVGPDTLVGVFLERSLEMVVALLAVLKAGGAYLPVDPEYPADRIAFMLGDAKCPVLLTQRHLATRVPAVACAVLDLEKDWDRIAGESDSDPQTVVALENLAYVIYTSGSTGNPKGAMNTHRGICNRLLWMQQQYGLAGLDRVLQKTPFSFDVSVWEFFWPLMVGAHLIVARPGGHRDADYLVDLIQEAKISVIHFVPSMLAAFLAEPDVDKCRSLRHIICSGEALTLPLQNQCLGLLPSQLHNLYGPTEAAVDVTFWACDRSSPLPCVPIGKPVANSRVYVLDLHQKPVPIGVPGELYIGGVQVGRGYLNRPELTAEKFVPDPFTNQPGAKLYRTGDLCRWLPNKTVEYLGRLDFQVKLHGLRIELGEIETVLGRQASVQQCVVVAREPQPGNKILVAYLEPRPGIQPDVSELRDHLKQSLPEYMVPSAFVLLDKLPLSPNGKIDRNALPNSDSLRLHAKGEFVAPRDSLEQMLAQLWAKVLRVKRVGLNDNFFELGGHSLLALRVALEIERSCHKRLPLATFLQAPTIAELAEVLRRDSWTPSWSSLVPIRPGGSKPPLFFMHSHGGNVLEYYPLANLLGEDQPVFALQARGLDGNIVRDESIEQIAAAYLSEIRLLQPQGPYFLSGFCFGGLVALEAAQQLVAAGDEVALVAMIQTTHPALSGFQPSDTLLRRWWHRTAKRFDLERSNLVHRGPGYLQERFLRAVAVARSRTLLKFDKLVSNGGPRPIRSSMPYVLEALGVEHDRAFDRYQPQPYGGRVVLFRAAKQLPGLAENPSLGWADVLGKSLTVINISGHQQNLLVEPNVLVLAKEFARLIHLAQSELLPELV